MPDIFAAFSTAGPALQSVLALLVLLLPFSLLLAAWKASRGSQHVARAWDFAERGALLAMLVAVLSGMNVWIHGAGVGSFAEWCPSIKLDALSVTMLLLTTFLGWVILRYSRNYLAGDKGVGHYLFWLCLTLATVWLLVIFNNLLLVCLAWSASSLALHQLLIFYKDRPAALMAAHKKFFISRAADVLTLVATLLLYVRFDTLELDRIANALMSVHEADISVKCAAFLFVISAILKCAQLPLHGWLLQVMEAPTPVSALLHAGIVNIGGFILLRVSGLLELVPAAQLLLVMVGSMTATLAALVMMTRISVKVMLAWSTCAQMGFMLLEIGLGAYSLALLHLLAHSLYKAYAFLAAGETVSRQRMLHIAPATHPLNFAQRCLAFAGLVLALALAGWLTGLDPRHDAVIWLLGLSHSAMSLWMIPLALLVGLTFAGLGLIMTALAPAYDFFLYYFTLVITPMMMICGVFFPVNQLPQSFQIVANALPLTHAIDLARPLMVGTVPPYALLHIVVLIAYALFGFYVSLVLFRRRLSK